MGFLDVITGKRKLAKPAPDRLFAMSTAYVTMETGLEITTRGAAAIVFQSLATADFTRSCATWRRSSAPPHPTARTDVQTSEDSYGFSWLVLRGTASMTSWWASMPSPPRSRAAATASACWRGVRLPGRARPPALSDLQLQAGRLLSVRAGRRERAARQRARARAQGPAGLRAPLRAGARRGGFPCGEPRSEPHRPALGPGPAQRPRRDAPDDHRSRALDGRGHTRGCGPSIPSDT